MSFVVNKRSNQSRSQYLSVCFKKPFYLAISSTVSLVAGVFFLLVTFVNPFHSVVAHAVGSGDFAGLVQIAGGRKIYLECRGAGSPSVVFVSGARGAHDDWTVLMDPTRPAGTRKPNESAVFPQVSRFIRVCAYDRPGTTLLDDKLADSTPVRQPTTAQQGVADLHALLIAAKEGGPYVLVGHSWGGLIARLFASTYPDEVVGLVLVDPASEFLKSSLTPAQWETYIKATKKLIESNDLEAPDHERSLDLLHGTPRIRTIPVVVLTSDKRFDFGAGGEETWSAWRTAQDRLAKLLNAKHVTDTSSGHTIQMEQPRLVIDAIRDVVDDVRNSGASPRNETDNELPPIAESSRIALEKALDEGEGKLRLEDTIERWGPQIAEASATTIYRPNLINLTN
jgi:pimeloyl-ACP methyl ester carboxylesterase